MPMTAVGRPLANVVFSPEAPAEMHRQPGDDDGAEPDADQRIAHREHGLVDAAPPRRGFLVDRRLPDRPADAVAEAEQVAHHEHRQEAPGSAHGGGHEGDEADGL